MSEWILPVRRRTIIFDRTLLGRLGD